MPEPELHELRKLFNLSIDVLCVVAPDGTLRAVNPAFERIFGCASDDVVGDSFWSFIHPDDVEMTRETAQHFGHGSPPGGGLSAFENRCRTATGDTRWMQWSVAADPETGQLYACGRDITDRITELADSERLSRYTQVLESSHSEMRHALEQSSQDANSDSLTDLLNRRGFEQAAAAELSRASRHRHSFGIAIFDIDHFKDVNDRHGHAVGDAVLVEVAKRLDSNRRQYDLVGRWGGEEFVALFPETDLQEARLAAERLCLAIGARQLVTNNIRLRVTISAGVVAVPDGTTGNLAELVATADDALTRAKQNGRDRVEVAVLEAS